MLLAEEKGAAMRVMLTCEVICEYIMGATETGRPAGAGGGVGQKGHNTDAWVSGPTDKDL